MRAAALALVAVLIAGCVKGPVADPAGGTDGARDVVAGALHLASVGHRAGLSTLATLSGAPAKVTFPPGVLVLDEKRALVPAKGELALPVTYLPPWGARNLTVTVDGAEAALPLDEGAALVSGDLAVELLKVQRDRFPHRTPGMPNYAKAEQYFADFFKALNMTVETNSYGQVPKLPVGGLSGGSLESVVGKKKGTLATERYLVFGGHFDVVPGTTEGASDDTCGAVSVLALATAFANVTTRHSILFAEWGGEENGLYGSQAWITSHPQLAPFIDAYLNLDANCIAWPAPREKPDPILFTAGPDGLVYDALLANKKEIERTWLQSGGLWKDEPIAQGQAAGGFNAQSDHTSFMARGIPVTFTISSNIAGVESLFHTEKDTVENLTKYSLYGPQGVGQELNASEMAEGERYLSRSLEVQMMLGFYFVTLWDNGALALPKPAPPSRVI